MYTIAVLLGVQTQGFPGPKVGSRKQVGTLLNGVGESSSSRLPDLSARMVEVRWYSTLFMAHEDSVAMDSGVCSSRSTVVQAILLTLPGGSSHNRRVWYPVASGPLDPILMYAC